MIKQALLILTFLITLTISASAQGSSTAFRFRTGTPLPSTCRVGDVFYKNSATAGQYNCTATNTWTLAGAPAGTVTTAGLTPGTLPVALTSMTLGDSLIIQSGANIVQIGGTVNAAIQVDYDNHKVFAYSDNIIDGPAFFATNELKSEAQLAGARGGTGVANSGKTITLGGNLVTSGAFATTITSTATTSSTLPAGTHSLAPLDSPVFTGAPTIPTPFTLGAVSVTATGTELNYSVGVTSAIQTQLNGKQASGSYAASGANSDITSLSGVTAITGGASNMTLTSGIGNSRTMILRTTTSGGTATTALTLDASQNAQFAGTDIQAIAANAQLSVGASIYVGRTTTTGVLGSWSRGFITFNADGVWEISNNAVNDFGRLQLGGTTSSFPALGRSTTRLTVGLADGTAGGGINFSTASVISIASGTNQRAGNLTLVGGTSTVSNTTVTANSIVILTRKTSGGTIGTAITYTLSAGTSFTVNSDNILDTSVFSYVLIEVP